MARSGFGPDLLEVGHGHDEESSSSASHFISSFCTDQSWSADNITGSYKNFYFGDETPCFNDVVIVCSAHVLFVAFCLLRLKQLLNRKVEKYRLRHRWPNVCKIVFSVIGMVCPILELNTKLEDRGIGGARSRDPYGPGKHMLPFEAVYCGVMTLAYLLFTILQVFEMRATVHRGQWISRFLPFLSLACLTVRLIFYLQFYSDNHRTFEYYAILFFVQYSSVAILALFALLHWPNTSDYNQFDYQWVPLINPELASAEAPGITKVCPESTTGLYGRLVFFVA
jgi:hypothetical protein